MVKFFEKFVGIRQQMPLTPTRCTKLSGGVRKSTMVGKAILHPKAAYTFRSVTPKRRVGRVN